MAFVDKEGDDARTCTIESVALVVAEHKAMVLMNVKIMVTRTLMVM